MPAKHTHARRIIGFTLVFVLLFIAASHIFERKSVEGAWNYTYKMDSFYNLEPDSIDLMGFGSSHMYCSIVPEVMDGYGFSTYVLATQRQPIAATYHYIKEAFKTQHPRYVLCEAYILARLDPDPDDAVLFDAITPLRLSANKLGMIRDLTRGKSLDDTAQFYLTMLKYHDRWKELNRNDFFYTGRDAEDPYRGSVYVTEAKELEAPDPALMEAATAATLSEDEIGYLRRIEQLCTENRAQLVLIYAPHPSVDEHYGNYLAVKEYCESEGLPFIDGVEAAERIDFDYAADFYDEGHLNATGARKFSPTIGEYLTALEAAGNDAEALRQDEDGE